MFQNKYQEEEHSLNEGITTGCVGRGLLIIMRLIVASRKNSLHLVVFSECFAVSLNRFSSNSFCCPNYF